MSKISIDENTVKNIITATKAKTKMTNALPFNGVSTAIRNIPSLAEDVYFINTFEGTNNLIDKFSTNLSLDTNCTQGNKSLRITPTTPVGNNANVGGMCIYTPNTPIDLSNYTYVQYDLYVPKYQEGAQFQVNFVSGTTEDGFNWITSAARGAGWYRFRIEKSGISMPVAADWSSIAKIRFTYFNTNQVNDGIYFLVDNLIAY